VGAGESPHTEVFREPKRRAVFELLFGLSEPEQMLAETELGAVRYKLKGARARAFSVEIFLLTANVADEAALGARPLPWR
jgi:hypothetical protein